MSKNLKKAYRLLPKVAPHYVKPVPAKSEDGHDLPDIRVNSGGVVLSHDNMIVRFPNKFERAPEHDEKEAPVPALSSPTPAIPQSSEDSPEGVQSVVAQGQQAKPDDVTSEFPKAEKAGLKVLKHPDQKLFAVLDDDGDIVKGGADLESKAAVNRVLDAYVKA